MQAQSPFFSLPQEVRDHIYELYLTFNHTFNHTDFGDTLRPRHMYMDVAAYSRPLPALMFSCKRAYQELASAVHGQALMRVEMRGRNERRIGFAIHGTLHFDRLVKLWLLVATEHTNWNRWLSFFGEVIQRARNLKALVIDWEPRVFPYSEWAGRVNTKKEDEFFGIIASLKTLEVIEIHGSIPDGWKSRLEGIAKHVVYYRYRWWREPGLE
ncbi:hypothetical protein F5B20DRAFT_535360 [Whalleya microplaca]|nr:hypothetical protein F5B20DRAFT_535360 [Whalleya microplaca]